MTGIGEGMPRIQRGRRSAFTGGCRPRASKRGEEWSRRSLTLDLEHLGELVGEDGTAEIISLRFVTLVGLQKSQLFLCLHPFGNDSQPQASAHADDRGHDCRLVGSGGDLADERLVDLERIDRELSQIAQAGVSRAEVIDRQLYSSCS